jgi:hypothetical protein
MPDENVLPGFDAVQYMREQRDRISRDIEGMSRDEILRYFNTDAETADNVPPISADPDVEAAWADELAERLRAYRAGEMRTFSAEDVLRAGHEFLR